MKQIHIGLDFGTNQTKCCIFDVHRNTREFFKFDNGQFFLPSEVGVTTQGTFLYGYSPSDEVIQRLLYFKIASAEDEEFLLETDDTSTSYDTFDYGGFAPEFLSVIYITFVLFSIKERYQTEKTPQKNTIGGFIGRFIGNQEESEAIQFAIQLGIPTEWSQKKNLRRKRKFESILLISQFLQDKFKTKSSFLKATAEELKTEVKSALKRIKAAAQDKEQFDGLLNDNSLSVFPETAAGLNVLINNKQLKSGYYAAMDIGAGSTDISFFKVIGEQIKYIASESYLLGANSVYRRYKNCDSLDALKKSEQTIRNNILDPDSIPDKIEYVLKDVNDLISKKAKKLFARRVKFFERDILKRYTGQPVILYGGGGQLPTIDNFSVEIWGAPNGGVSWRFESGVKKMEKIQIQDYIEQIPNIINPIDEYKRDLPLLVVALGLSYIRHDSAAEWFDESHYIASDRDRQRIVEIAHPFNEDCYIYDVIDRHF